MSRPSSYRPSSRLAFALGLAVAGLGTVAAVPALATGSSVVSRPAEDIAQDADRKPGMMIRFSKVKPGNMVVEILPGKNYFTRIFSNAVGPKGKVRAIILRDSDDARAIAAEPGRQNVEVAVGALDDLAPAGSADVVWTSRNYHDLKGSKLPADAATKLNSAAFAALKPGGYYIVLDHSAQAGSGFRDVDTLHRVDAEAVKAEIISAGFEFAGESKFLVNKADDRTVEIHDPAIRGRTDQFVLRFRKPG